MATANQYEVTNFVAKVMTAFFDQKQPILNTANNDYVVEFGTSRGYASGMSINIKVPGYPDVATGLSTQAQRVEDKVTPYTISDEDIYNVTYELSVLDTFFEIVGGRKALMVKKERAKAVVDDYCTPVFLAISAKLQQVAAKRMQVAAYYTPIDEPSKLGKVNAFSDVSGVGAMADELKFGVGQRYAMLNITDATQVVNSLQNMMNPMINQKITQYARVGGPSRGHLAGFDMYQSADIGEHRAGEQYAISPLFKVASVAPDGSTMTFKEVGKVTSRLFKAGDRISLPTVHIVNRVSRARLRYKLVVTVAQEARGDGKGQCVVKLSEPLVVSGQHANVTQLPKVDDKAVLYPDHRLNFFYVPAGLSAVALPLQDIYGAMNSQVSLTDVGRRIPIKVYAQGNVSELTNIFRASCLVATKAFSPYLIVLPSRL